MDGRNAAASVSVSHHVRDIDADAWEFTDGCWRHRPWWKVAINSVLRSLQPWPRKLVIYTRTVAPPGPDREDARPRAIGYGVGRVLHTS